MGRFNRTNRPYVRQSRKNRQGSALAAKAGAAPVLSDRATVEQLERRQMLFSLTITADDVNPQTGVGSVRAFFNYFLPYLTTDVEVDDDPQVTTITEDFNDEEPGGPVGSGTFFTESNILTRHNLPISQNRYAIDPVGTDNITDRQLRVALQNQGDFFNFQTFVEGSTTQRTASRSVEFLIAPDNAGDATGLDTDRVVVSLMLNNRVVQTFSGAALRALIQVGPNEPLFTNPAAGLGRFVINAPDDEPGFDMIRFEQVAAYGLGGAPQFRLDNLSFTEPPSPFNAIVDSRAGFGAVAILSGPVGASVTITDLYGRDMRASFGVGTADGANRANGDPNGDGIPDFNDGIGAIRFSGTDSRTSFTLWGTTVETADTAPDDADFFVPPTVEGGGFAWTIVEELLGSYDAFEGAGFGYAFNVDNDQVEVTGLPPGPGSVIVGAPTGLVRSLTNYNPGGAAPGGGFSVTTGFTDASQGFFVTDGGNMGGVYLHGILHGSSRFDGFLDRMYVGYMVGSLTVDGDLGQFHGGTDAGKWAPDPDFVITDPNVQVDPINKTFSQIVVGRTVGEIAFAGRGLVDITVIGDLNSPTTRPARDSFHFYERESIYGINPAAEEAVVFDRILETTNSIARLPTDLFRTPDQAIVYGTALYRNDSILAAEWIGSAATGVNIQGELSGQDPLQGEDSVDIFAFAVDGTTDIVVQGTNSLTTAPYYRIVDQDGRTLAAPQTEAREGNFSVSQMRFRPKGPGVYYLVISDPAGNETQAGTNSYSVILTGMAATTLGAYRTGGGSGFTDINTGEGNSLTVLSGSLGSMRIGTAFLDGDGDEVDPTEIYNTTQEADDSMSFQGGFISVAGSIFNITTGSDIGDPNARGSGGPIDVRANGDFGTLVTGLSPALLAGVGQEGDLNFFALTVGGRIGSFDVRGGVGLDQDPEGANRRGTGGPVSIVSGNSGGNGSIGFIRVGFHVVGDLFSVRTSPGSTIGGLLVSQDAYNDADPRSGIYLGNQGIPITTGLGSDVRFTDTPQIDLFNSVDTFQPLIGDSTLELTDDAGARVRISVDNAPPGTQVGLVRTLPIDGSQGVAIAAIEVDLTGGRTLRIVSSNPTSSAALVSIGRIVITGSDIASNIDISGNAEVDIYQIVDAGGGGLLRIDNRTTGGDIVAADLASLGTISINSGNLGRTQVPAWGPSLIGPELGVDVGFVGAVGGALGIGIAGGDDPAIDDDFNGGVFRPLRDDNFDAGNAYLDDIGSPLDGTLNGLVVRTGSVAEVRVAGSVGDVLLQDDAGILTLLTANSDNVSGLGRFDGIVGTILANDIARIDIGDGLAENDPDSPLSTTGIYALDDITEVVSARSSGAAIRGAISASNRLDPDLTFDSLDGVGNITINNGVIQDAYIGAQTIDGFWESFNYGEDNISLGDVNRITGNTTNMFRTLVVGRDLGEIRLNNSYFDASSVQMTGNIGTITALGYRNSTLSGGSFERFENSISSARDVQRISAVNDMSDLVIDVVGRVFDGINARNIIRSTIDVDSILASLTVTNDLRASNVNVGELPRLSATNSIQSSSIFVSGPLSTLSAGHSIVNSRIEVTGPDGRLDNISARYLISGTIAAAGPINSVSVSQGDITATILTTTSGGNVGRLSASRDLAIRSDISGNLSQLSAGRHIGSISERGIILVRGNLSSASAPNGQLYADLRVGGAITGSVTLGGALNKPESNLVGQGSIVAFDRINSVVINGDFDGDIISYTNGIASVAINNGSLLPGNTIAAYDGDLSSVTITNGSLFGNVHADYNLTSLRVVAGADGVFGDIGVNPASSAGVSYDARRNQLPLGVAPEPAVQGPRISAGYDIVNVTVTGGSVFETTFVAGRVVRTLAITGGFTNDGVTAGVGSYVIAGDLIDSVTVTGDLANVDFIAGINDLGDDDAVGGTQLRADTVRAGSIRIVTSNGVTRNVRFFAGVTPGANGVYQTPGSAGYDDRLAQGLSTITTLALANADFSVVAVADTLSSSVANDNRLNRTSVLEQANPQIDNGVGTPGTAFSGTQTFNLGTFNLTVTVSGPGQAFFDTVARRLTLRNSTTATNVTLASSNGVIDNIDIVTNDDASLGVVRLQGSVAGDSDIIVDGNLTTLEMGATSGTGSVVLGGDAGTVTYASLIGGFFEARNANSVRVNGDFGASNSFTFGEARIDLLSGGSITITGASRALVSVDRDLNSLSLPGFTERSAFRFGGSLQSLSAATLRQTVVSAGNRIGSVVVGGEAFDTSIAAGADLGDDAAFGGSGVNADTVSSGFIGNVNVSGNFRESDVVAGFLRGPDTFFGTSDDKVAPGRSSIGSVTISGSQVGSSRNSESYRIASSGSLGTVRIGGATFSGTFGNFATETPLLAPLPIQVLDVRIVVESRVSTANIVFNQPIDASTLSRALSVSEVRGAGDIEIRLIEGPDYTISYDPRTNTARVRFSESVTSRNLPVVPGEPGPGLYRFQFDQDVLRAKLDRTFSDGNRDGLIQPGDDINEDAAVGDAGDKLVAETVQTGTNNSLSVDLYAPVNLDVIFDNNASPDGLPDANRTITVRGFIGDHPDNDTNFFRFAGDADLYSVTLQAGQIIRLGALQGSGLLAGLTLFTSDGTALGAIADSADAVSLPVAAGLDTDLTFPTVFLIKRTGTYIIGVGDTSQIATPGAVSNPNPRPGGLGDYNFTVEIFDDGDSGFTSTTNSGDGAPVVNAPPAIDFAVDGIFGNGNDLSEIVVGSYRFTLNVGADGLPNTGDDVVTGSASGDGTTIVSTRDGNGRLTSVISSAIGTPGHTGVPTDIASDVDVYHLNNRNAITPGTKLRLTVKLAALGADLGSASAITDADNRGEVQFAVFDTSVSQILEDASLVFSPTDFSPNGGTPNKLIADNGVNRYGYDQNGDFFVEFITPDRIGTPGAAPTLAVYLQGVNNTDYVIEVVTDGTGELIRQAQNVFIETGGGLINWLEAGGLTTELEAFSARVLGFTGTIDGVPVQDYILSNLVTSLNNLFQGALGAAGGFDVRFSTNVADFEFQPFSTVFLSASSDPVVPLFDPFTAFNFFDVIGTGFFNTQPFGFSERSDPFNTDLQDEAVVFVPSFALEGFNPGRSDVDLFVQALTASVSRRVGELVGLRITEAYGANTTAFDPLAANSVDDRPGAGRNYSISATNRSLSSSFDTVERTNFFLGQQNSASLLDKVLGRI